MQVSGVAPQTVGAGADAERQSSDESGAESTQVTPRQRLGCYLVFLASLADGVVTLILLCIALIHAFADNGVSLYCMGIMGLVHWLTSLILILRMLPPLFPRMFGHTAAEQALVAKDEHARLVREQAMFLCMGTVLLISSCAMVFKAVRKLQLWDSWYEDHQEADEDAAFALTFLAFYGLFWFSIQVLFRAAGCCLFRGLHFRNFFLLTRQALVASVVALVFMLVLGVAASQVSEWSWKAEPLAALVLAVVTIVEGARVIIANFKKIEAP